MSYQKSRYSILFQTLFQALLFVLTFALPLSAFALNHPYFSKHPKAAKKLERLIAQARLQALESQPADLSLELKDLQNNNYTLQKHRGQVLMLTRWATW